MGLEESAMVLNGDVFVRTELGAKEVENVIGSGLSREARTLLILIDGRKSYAQVTRLLENRKMFRNTGGLKQHLKMLIDLDYIKFSNPDLASVNDGFSESGSELSEITLFTKAYDEYAPSGTLEGSKSDAIDVSKKSNHEKQTFKQLRSIMLALIVKYGEKSTAEKYSKKLKKCHSIQCVFSVIQTLRAESSGQFEVALTMAARAFKNSKIA